MEYQEVLFTILMNQLLKRHIENFLLYLPAQHNKLLLLLLQVELLELFNPI